MVQDQARHSTATDHVTFIDCDSTSDTDQSTQTPDACLPAPPYAAADSPSIWSLVAAIMLCSGRLLTICCMMRGAVVHVVCCLFRHGAAAFSGGSPVWD